MQFEWDPKKARVNLSKHRVTFKEATTVFMDNFSLTGDDPDHSFKEDRFVIFGQSSNGHLLVVAYTEGGERIQIISARPVTKSEMKLYEEG